MGEPASGPRPSVPAPVTSVPMDTEQGRAFLQERIALFSKVVFALSTFFYVFGNALALQHHGNTLSMVLTHPGNVLHLAAALVGLAAWLVTRRGSLSQKALNAIDVGQVLVAMALYSVMASLSAESEGARPDMLISLICMLTLTARAIVVPSTPRHTLTVGVLASLLVMIPGWVYGRVVPSMPGVSAAFHILAYLTLWSASSVAVSTLASRVIYGLRRQVAEAQQLGQYLLDEKIGEGGMGAVYKARHALLRRPTAIKLLLTSRAGAVNLTRFEREVQLTSRLTHPNTVAIFDYGRTPDGVFYYAMEYLEGLDLDRLVELDGAQPPARVIHIMQQVAGALSEAHGVGLVHRDIKPANIILCERGGVPDVAKVVDFGLVKELSSADPALSNMNTIVGTPLFMPPEALVSPDKVDARSDLYALGGVAYYLLTGTPLFTGNLMEVCAKHMHDQPEPPSARLGRTLPADLEAIVLSCLEKDPDKRPQSARDLQHLLSACTVPAWSEEAAHTWWIERGTPLMRGAPRRAAPPESHDTGVTALTVDIRKRAANA